MERGADAFRIDSLKHVDPVFARSFARHLQDDARQLGRSDLYLCGEWLGGGAGHAASMEFYHSAEDLDLLDFSLAYSLRNALAGREPMSKLGAQLRLRRAAFRGRETWQATFLDNHDMPRIGTHLARELDGRSVEPGSPEQRKELVRRRIDMGFVLLLTAPGIPVVYYGTEQYAGVDGVREEDEKTYGLETCGRVWMPSCLAGGWQAALVRLRAC